MTNVIYVLLYFQATLLSDFQTVVLKLCMYVNINTPVCSLDRHFRFKGRLGNVLGVP